MSTPGQLVDELAEAPREAVASVLRQLPVAFFEDVCSVVEYELYRRYRRSDLPSLSEFHDASLMRGVTAIVNGAHAAVPRSLRLQPVNADVIPIPKALGRDAVWTAFVKRAEMTARAAGFPEGIAAGLAGAIQEMADNVVQHSEAPASGIAAFARIADRFEYVVGDAGIGMLASLRKAAEFRSLRDDLEALPLAVMPGVSRHGPGTGRGYGFRAVFLPLRAGHGVVRLRSGTGVLEMHGVSIQPDEGRCSQRPQHQGVVVAVQLSPRY